jgi:hypothetical protein
MRKKIQDLYNRSHLTVGPSWAVPGEMGVSLQPHKRLHPSQSFYEGEVLDLLTTREASGKTIEIEGTQGEEYIIDGARGTCGTGGTPLTNWAAHYNEYLWDSTGNQCTINTSGVLTTAGMEAALTPRELYFRYDEWH